MMGSSLKFNSNLFPAGFLFLKVPLLNCLTEYNFVLLGRVYAYIIAPQSEFSEFCSWLQNSMILLLCTCKHGPNYFYGKYLKTRERQTLGATIHFRNTYEFHVYCITSIFTLSRQMSDGVLGTYIVRFYYCIYLLYLLTQRILSSKVTMAFTGDIY